MGRALSVADKAVALAALDQIIRQWGGDESLADEIIAAAMRVEFQPNTRRLVLTFDLSGPAEPTSD